MCITSKADCRSSSSDNKFLGQTIITILLTLVPNFQCLTNYRYNDFVSLEFISTITRLTHLGRLDQSDLIEWLVTSVVVVGFPSVDITLIILKTSRRDLITCTIYFDDFF